MLVICGDCLDVLPTLEAESIDTCLCDPPSGINFMGRKWDSHNRYEARTDKGKRTQDALLTLELEPWEAGFIAFTVDWASEVLRVLKPGASALVWALPRTSDLTVLGLRLAGFEIRDNFYHVFAQGFPKSYSISKGIDRKNGKERENTGELMSGHTRGRNRTFGTNGNIYGSAKDAKAYITIPATPDAKLWDGYGTGLKPAAEEWVWAMKPVDGGFVNNALKWGVSGLWIDGGRVGASGNDYEKNCNRDEVECYWRLNNSPRRGVKASPNGRWPANVLISHNDRCRRVGEKRVRGITGGKNPIETGNSIGTFEEKQHRPFFNYTDPDGTETIDDWECVDGWQITPPPDMCIYCGQSDPVEQECKDLAIDYIGIILNNINFIPFECQYCGESQRWEFVRVQCPVRQLGEQSGETNSPKNTKPVKIKGSNYKGISYRAGDFNFSREFYQDTGTAARFFYQAKSSPRERHYGCDALYWRIDKGMPVGFVRIDKEEWEQLPDEERAKGNIHPTIKPLELVRYLVRLTRTPTGGVVLDPFAGSGTTGLACIDEGRDYILIEREREYCDIAEAKLAAKLAEVKQMELDLC